MIPRAKALAKQAVFAVLGSDLALGRRLRRIARSDALTILNLHRVDDHVGSAYEAMKPALFEELVRWLQGSFRIVTFADLDQLAPSAKPPLILSFDDGYKDFVEVVAPILAKHRVRVNQNVIPACIESGRPPMNVVLQDFIGTAPAALLRELTISGLPEGIDPDDRVRSGNRASAALKSRPIAEQKTIFTEIERQFVRFDEFRTTPVMTLEDVREVAGAHEIGAHSFEHAGMAAETDDYLEDDLHRCRAYLQEKIGLPPRVYAFPNGSFRAGQEATVLAASFEHVLLVGNGWSNATARIHGRFGLHAVTMAEAKFRATGGFRRPPQPSIG